jgi:hypothetical protein
MPLRQTLDVEAVHVRDLEFTARFAVMATRAHTLNGLLST